MFGVVTHHLPRLVVKETVSVLRNKQFTYSKRRNVSQIFHTDNKNGLFKVSEEVADALHHGRPVVALESTIITHGMPNPHNVKTALEVESIVREQGCTPATIAVMKGKVHVGVSNEDLTWLGSQDKGLVKVSRRDFPYVLAQELSGGTTVSGTMLVAHKMGIPIFVTGGIGGVHRGAESSMDVSADLTELGRTPVAVVSAGVKSILDIERTLEYLETQGVCVATYGSSRDFPAFFTSRSGFLSPYNVASPTSAAALIDSNMKLNTGSGMIIAVPIPEDLAASGEMIEAAIQTAIKEASAQGVKGKDVTPFILSQIHTITGGASLESNIALIKNNAEVGSRIAKSLNEMKTGSKSSGPNLQSARKHTKTSEQDTSRPVVVGGTIVDFYVRLGQEDVQCNGATYRGSLKQAFGGVGRNLADCLTRLGADPLLVSAVGKNSHTGALQAYCQHMDLSGLCEVEDAATATYCGILESSGEMMFGVGDMDIFSSITPNMISQFKSAISRAPLVVVDGNVSPATIQRVCELCQESGVPVWFDPADQYKAVKPFSTQAKNLLTYASPNVFELLHMWEASTGKQSSHKNISPDTTSLEEIIDICLPYACDLVKTIPVVLVTLGCHGVLLCHRLGSSQTFPTRTNQVALSRDVKVLHFPACTPDQLPPSTVSVSGAGDCLNSGMMNAIIQGQPIDLCVKAGLKVAQFSLQSHHAIPPSITSDAVDINQVKQWAPWSPRLIKS